MTGPLDRRDALRGAERLGALSDGGDLPTRYGFFGRAGPAHGFDAVAVAAAWPVTGLDEMALFQLCVGAAASAGAWRWTMDGGRMREWASVLSEPVLDAILALDADALPVPLDAGDGRPDAEALTELGRRLLLAALPGPAGSGSIFPPAHARMAVEAGAAAFARRGPAHA